MPDTDEFLAHFGVLGMKWGHRKDGSSHVKVAKASTHTHTHNDHSSDDVRSVNDSIAKVKTHGTKALSNQELQNLVTRMNLEQQYGRLKGANLSKGQKFAAGLTKASSEIAINTAKSIAAEQLKKAITGGITKAAAKAATGK